MSVICNNTVPILRCSVGLANFSRLISRTQHLRISSQEIFQRENKVIAKNYDPLPVVIAKGEGIDDFHLIFQLFED